MAAAVHPSSSGACSHLQCLLVRLLPLYAFLQGLRSWSYAVAPKLQLLSEVLGSEQQAAALIASCPAVLKLPVEAKLQPVLGCLAAAGVKGEQLAQLLRGCPKLLAEPRESIVARWVGSKGERDNQMLRRLQA